MAEDRQNELKETAELARNVTRLALEATTAQLASGTHRDPAGAARNAAVVYGISIDKRHALEDRPAPPPEAPTRDVRDSLRDLYRQHPGIFWSVGLRMTPESVRDAGYIDRALADPDKIDELEAERQAERALTATTDNSAQGEIGPANARARVRTDRSV